MHRVLKPGGVGRHHRSALGRAENEQEYHGPPDTGFLRGFWMAKQIIRTPDAPSSPLFSQAVKVGPIIYVSGIVGVDPKTNSLAGSTIQEQTRQAIINCEKILHAAG